MLPTTLRWHRGFAVKFAHRLLRRSPDDSVPDQGAGRAAGLTAPRSGPLPADRSVKTEAFGDPG